MAGERVTRRTAIMVKLEAVYGVAETTFAATDAILLAEPPQFLIEPDNVDRNLVTPWLGNSEQLPATRRAKLNFKVELAGSGAAGTAPAWGKLMRGCGFAETVFAGNRVEYTPLNELYEGLTFRFFRDGVRYLARGGRGMSKFLLNSYGIPMAEFEFWAFDAQALATSIPAIDVSNFIRPEVVTDANSGDIRLGATLTTGTIAGGTVLQSKGISLDFGIKLDHRKLLGGERIAIMDRKVSGQMTVELDAATEITWRADVNANTLTTLGFNHGTTAGNRIGVFMPRMQRTTPQGIDDDGSLLIQNDLRALPGTSGAPEIIIIAK